MSALTTAELYAQKWSGWDILCVFYHSEKPAGGQGEPQLGGTPEWRKDLSRFLLEEESINKQVWRLQSNKCKLKQ